MEPTLELTLLLVAWGISSLLLIQWSVVSLKLTGDAFPRVAAICLLPLKIRTRSLRNRRSLFVRRKCPPRSAESPDPDQPPSKSKSITPS